MGTVFSNNNIQLGLFGIILVVMFVAISNQEIAKQYDVSHILPEKAYELLSQEGEKLVILDVRERDAYDKEHLPNAIAVPIGELDNRLQEFEANKTDKIVIYCNEGSKRGLRATDTMNKAGFDGAVNLKGGIEAWRSAKLPTVGK